jgi:2-oxoglutarate dehydrogenase E1 component
LLIHGDAAFAGRGIVAETLNMSQLPGYGTGGTLHVVVNNQIGFTTLPEDARSSMYATDVAKMIEVPILHVNGDDPLAVLFVTQMSLDFRQEFGRDAVIDMYCYRRFGHNEGDEPSFTQPHLYARIEERPPVAQLYKKELFEAGTLGEDEAASLEAEFEMRLELVLQEVNQSRKKPRAQARQGIPAFFSRSTDEGKPTAISRDASSDRRTDRVRKL